MVELNLEIVAQQYKLLIYLIFDYNHQENKRAYQKHTTSTMKRKHDENVIYTEDEGVIDNCQFHVKMEVIIQECLEKADKAFTNDDGTRKMTEAKFRKLFEFERAETEMVQNINRSMSAFMKKNEQKAMRNFIELSSWRMNQMRKIKQNSMSLSTLKKKLLKNYVCLEEMESVLYLFQTNSLQFVKPMFIKEFSNCCYIQRDLEKKKKHMAVQLFIMRRILKIIIEELPAKHCESIQLANYPIAGYGEQRDDGFMFPEYAISENEDENEQGQIFFPSFLDFRPDLNSNFIPFESSPAEQGPVEVLDIIFVENSSNQQMN